VDYKSRLLKKLDDLKRVASNDAYKYRNLLNDTFTCVICRKNIAAKHIVVSQYYVAELPDEKDKVALICPDCTQDLLRTCGGPIPAERTALDKKGLVLRRAGIWPEKDTHIKDVVAKMNSIVDEVLNS